MSEWYKAQNNSLDLPVEVERDEYNQQIRVRKNFEQKTRTLWDGEKDYTVDFYEYDEKLFSFSEYETYLEVQDAINASHEAHEALMELGENHFVTEDRVTAIEEAMVEMADDHTASMDERLASLEEAILEMANINAGGNE